MPVIGLASVGIAGGLRALDFLREHRRPLRPREQPALMQGDRHREGLRLPRLAENRAFCIARNARHGIGRVTGKRGVDAAHSRRLEIRSNASIETLKVGSAPAPQSSFASNTTV